MRELVYLSAYLLVDGETMQQAGRRFGTSVGRVVTPDPQRGCFDIDLAAARTLFYSGCSAADADWALARLRPEPLAPVSTPARLSDARYGRVPRSFIACDRDASIPPASQDAMLERLPCRRLSLDTGHAPMLSHPDELAAVLDQIARDPA